MLFVAFFQPLETQVGFAKGEAQQNHRVGRREFLSGALQPIVQYPEDFQPFSHAGKDNSDIEIEHAPFRESLPITVTVPVDLARRLNASLRILRSQPDIF